MLVLTPAAVQVVKTVTSAPQAPEGAGLRISSSTPEPQDAGVLQVTAAEGPAEDDHVLDNDGARIFLEPHAAAYLDDKVLDAQVNEQGAASFTLAQQS